MKTIFRVGAWTIASLIAAGCVAWSTAALLYDLPGLNSVGASAFALAVLAAIVFLRGAWRKLGALFSAFAIVLVWWLSLAPSDVRPWQPDVARTAWADVNGDEIVLHNVRNCEYRTETDYTPRWETRTVRLSELSGVDLAINYWGSPFIAHPIVSFTFANGSHVAFSIETRKETGESYSAIRGFFRQYELIYVVADERDVIRVRTNYRHGEDIYLYRLNLPPGEIRERFLDYLAGLNELHRHPAWYNALTSNCTTSIRAQHAAAKRQPFDWRLLANGKMDELLYERGLLDRSLPFAELKRRAHINAASGAANDAADFSARIRAGLPGF